MQRKSVGKMGFEGLGTMRSAQEGEVVGSQAGRERSDKCRNPPREESASQPTGNIITQVDKTNEWGI